MQGDRGDDSRDTATKLRGRLAEVFMKALVDGSINSLLARLGSQATLDEPIFGRVTGSSVSDRIPQLSRSWRSKQAAFYERGDVIVGVDSDALEGELTFSNAPSLPVVTIVHRLKQREVDVRLYHSASSLGVPPKGPLALRPSTLQTPAFLCDHFSALLTVDQAQAIERDFEADALLRDARGSVHERTNGALLSYYAGVGRSKRVPCSVTDNGRMCAVEYAVEGDTCSRLVVFERGESGLLKEARFYADDP